MTSDSPRWGSVVFEEAQEQKRFVEGLVERIKRFQEWTNAAPGRMVVLDTNVLLHYQPPSQVPWREVLAEPLLHDATGERASVGALPVSQH